MYAISAPKLWCVHLSICVCFTAFAIGYYSGRSGSHKIIWTFSSAFRLYYAPPLPQHLFPLSTIHIDYARNSENQRFRIDARPHNMLMRTSAFPSGTGAHVCCCHQSTCSSRLIFGCARWSIFPLLLYLIYIGCCAIGWWLWIGNVAVICAKVSALKISWFVYI